MNALSSMSQGYQLGNVIRERELMRQQQQAQIQKQQQYQQDITDFVSNPDPKKVADLMLKYPEQRQAVQTAWQTMDDSEKEAHRKNVASTYAATISGNRRVFAEQINRQLIEMESRLQDSGDGAMRQDSPEIRGAIQRYEDLYNQALDFENVSDDEWKRNALGTIGATAALTLDKEELDSIHSMTGHKTEAQKVNEMRAQAELRRAQLDELKFQMETNPDSVQNRQKRTQYEIQKRQLEADLAKIANEEAELEIERKKLELPVVKDLSAGAEKYVLDRQLEADSAIKSAEQFRMIETYAGDEAGLVSTLKAQLGGIAGGAVFENTATMSQLIRALHTKLAVGVREPGSGATSNFEMELYMKSIPNLGDTPRSRKIAARYAEFNASRMSRLQDTRAELTYRLGRVPTNPEIDDELNRKYEDWDDAGFLDQEDVRFLIEKGGLSPEEQAKWREMKKPEPTDAFGQADNVLRKYTNPVVTDADTRAQRLLGGQ